MKTLYKCWLCNGAIYFDDIHISDSGKKIPLNPETETPHRCPAWQSKTLRCNACDKEIFFDDNYISKYGKKIPLSKSTGNPHRCRNKPFNRDTRRAWWYQQEYKARQERERRREEERKKRQEDEFHKRFWEEWEKERDRERYEENKKQQDEQERKRGEEQARKEAEERYRRRYYQQHQKTLKSDQYYCQVLGISMDATEKEITAAYQKLSLQYHPDRCKDLSWEEANAKMAIINEAYENVLLTAK